MSGVLGTTEHNCSRVKQVWKNNEWTENQQMRARMRRIKKEPSGILKEPGFTYLLVYSLVLFLDGLKRHVILTEHGLIKAKQVVIRFSGFDYTLFNA